MGTSYIVLSTNIPLRQDGLPYAHFRKIDDTGVAVYFQYQEKPMTFACDRWNNVSANVQAIRKTIEALRGIERWGASDMMQRAFTGFEVLPEPLGSEWWHILDVSPQATHKEIRDTRNRLAKRYHPDTGEAPDGKMMAQINAAFQQAMSRGNTP